MPKNNYINILLLSGSGLIGGALNYIYHPIMLKYLSIEDFGIFGSLVGLFNLLGFIVVGIVLFLNKDISSNIDSKKIIKYIFVESLKILGIIGLLLYCIFIVFSGYIANFLKIDDVLIIIIVGLNILFAFTGAGIEATLRGIKKFNILSIQAIVPSLIKLILGFVLVALGFEIYGAIIGFLFGTFITLAIGIGYLFSYFRGIEKIGSATKLLIDFSKNKKEIFNFFLISFFFGIFINIDVILVKNIFNETTSGVYAGISVLGKFLIFLLLSIETVYFGQIMEYKNKKIPIQLIRNPLMLIMIISFGALIFNYFLGGFILKTLKEELSNYTYIYLLTLVYYGLLALISFYIKILVSWGKYYINYVILFLILSLIILVYTFGKDSLENFIYSFIIVGTITTSILSVIFYREYKGLR